MNAYSKERPNTHRSPNHPFNGPLNLSNAALEPLVSVHRPKTKDGRRQGLQASRRPSRRRRPFPSLFIPRYF